MDNLLIKDIMGILQKESYTFSLILKEGLWSWVTPHSGAEGFKTFEGCILNAYYRLKG